MKTTKLHFIQLLVWPLAASLCVLGSARGQNTAAPVNSQDSTAQMQSRGQNQGQSDDFTRSEIAAFDQFLDRHPEIAEQLRKDPSLVDNREFVTNHPALQSYLQEHPAIRQEIKAYPERFMHAEDRYERHEEWHNGQGNGRDDNGREDVTGRQLADFDHFLNQHPEIAEQLRKDPRLVDSREFEQNHPALQSYLQEHPAIREEIKQNPDFFLHAENRYDIREDRRDGIDRRELASFDRFLDSHPEISEQLNKNPRLVDDREFVQNHPALQSYLQEHPQISSEIKEYPMVFMRSEDRYDQHENRGDRDMHGEWSSFGAFLGGHAAIADQLSKDPSLVKNQEFMANHPELQEYLKAHPAAEAELKTNPDTFIKSSTQFDAGGKMKMQPMVEPKPKQ